MSNDPALLNKTAVQILKLLKKQEVSPLDLLDTLAARIKLVDGQVNALPILCFERARKHARRLMQKPVAERGILAGMPIPIKDLSEVKGVRTTHGSAIFKDHISEASSVVVERLEAAGGVVYAKSNTPEFGAGANTFNAVFGATLNPWNTKRSAAGSSGGAAVALATGMAWLAHGSDMGGSLRNPASFNGIVGFRPTPGRVANTPGLVIDQSLGVQGPMARTVEDTALLLDAMAGEDARDPASKPRPDKSFLAQSKSGWKPRRVAFSADLGITPVDPEVAEITRKAAYQLKQAGVIVEEAHPDLSEAHQCFHVLRARMFAVNLGKLLKQHRDLFKPDLIWNIEEGFKLTPDDIIRAETQRHAMFNRMRVFFERYDLLLTPATILPAFPVDDRYPVECAGKTFPNYVEWLAIAYAITLCSCPALSLPAGLTKTGLPIGLQVVAAPNRDGHVLAGAGLIESLLDLRTNRVIDPRH